MLNAPHRAERQYNIGLYIRGRTTDQAGRTFIHSRFPSRCSTSAHIVCVRRLFVCVAGMRTTPAFPSRCSTSAHIVCVRRLFVCVAVFFVCPPPPLSPPVSCPMLRVHCHGQWVSMQQFQHAVASHACPRRVPTRSPKSLFPLCTRNIYQHPHKPRVAVPLGICRLRRLFVQRARLSGRSSSPQRASASAARAPLFLCRHVLRLCPSAKRPSLG